jgi:hypothetical protein
LVHPLHYSPSSPSTFLKWLYQVSMFHIHTCKENISTIFTFLLPLHLHSPSCYYPLLNMTCFTFHFIGISVLCSVGFCLGILPVNMLYFNQSNSLDYSSLSFSPYLVLFNGFQCVSLPKTLLETW